MVIRILPLILLGFLSLHYCHCHAKPSNRREELIRELMELEEQDKACPCQCQGESQRELYLPSPAHSRQLAPNDISPVKGKFFKIGVVPDPPSVMKREDGSGRIIYEGIVIDILDSHSRLLGFDYEILEPADGLPGIRQENGSFNGVVGLLQRGEIDMIYVIGKTTFRGAPEKDCHGTFRNSKFSCIRSHAFPLFFP